VGAGRLSDDAGPGPGGPEGAANAPAGSNVTAVTSQNWAGYAATGPAGSFGQVSASWVTSAAQPGSAEVIAEAPSNGAVPPLADSGTVNFAGATVNGAPIGGGANLNELTMQSAAGTPLATPSALTGGNAFSVTFDTTGSGNQG
jgi:hypothetical protein